MLDFIFNRIKNKTTLLSSILNEIVDCPGQFQSSSVKFSAQERASFSIPTQNKSWCLVCSASEKNGYSFLDFFLFSFGSCWLFFVLVLHFYVFFIFIKNSYFKEYLTSTFSYITVLKSFNLDFKFWFFLLFSFIVTSFFFAAFINLKENILAVSEQGVLDGRDVLENKCKVLIGNQKEIARALEIIFSEIQAQRIEPSMDTDYITFPEEVQGKGH